MQFQTDTQEVVRYRGQWGGTIENGEEMWWSEPDRGLVSQNSRARARFFLDVRQHFLIRFMREAIRRLAPLSKVRIVDFGCGTGGTTLNLSSYLKTPIDGYDVFETQLLIARKFASSVGSSCDFHLLEKGCFPDPAASVDIIYSADVLGHVPDVPAVLSDWGRVLKPGGFVVLFTESAHSEGDSSIAAKLSRQGFDLISSVPEHISLFPREKLEGYFTETGFEVLRRYSANVGHFFFFPKDYVLLLKGKSAHRLIYGIAWVWNRISKLFPFYPWPFQFMRLFVTYAFGRKAYGNSYFYLLRKK